MTYLDVIVKLLNTKEFGKVSANEMVKAPQSLDTQLALEQNRAEAFAHQVNLSDKDIYLADLLILLDYLTFVPYGKRGQARVNECLAEEGGDFKSYKSQKIMELLEKYGVNGVENLEASVEKFLGYLVSANQDLLLPESLAATIRIISGELDNAVSADKITGMKGRNKLLLDTVNKLSDMAKEGNTKINIDKFLATNAEVSKLNKEELEHFEKVTELTLPPKTLK